jgi:L-ascorbate metabolism protein UlaG (beta-lactamase superfamily)
MRRLLVAIASLALALPAVAQDPKQDPGERATTLRWFGQSFFQLETKGGQKIVFDPHAIPHFGRPLVQANIILVSHPHNDHAMTEAVEDHKTARIFEGVVTSKDGKKTDWKAIDEKVLKTRVRTLATYHDPVNGMQRGKNSVWIVEADGLVFCHLGDLGHELTAEQAKAIGKVDVLMVPIGGIYTLNGDQAKKVVEQLKPRLYVLPMHFGVPGYDELVGPDEFLDGQKNVKKTPTTNELVIAEPEGKTDGPTVVLLGWAKAGAKKEKELLKKP